ncbi:MAG: DNA repair protein RecO [Alphaproteobacteria bacterium ADurb.Bin438]|nr:MAG: DNA repair protein RecO [Alphaproteobacteria bacterium ADurb.Bin438]
MIKIEDEGIIINIRSCGENGAVISVLSENNGIVNGYISKLSNRKNNNLYHISNHVKFSWQSRLEENLGSFSMSLIKGYASIHILDKIKSAMLMSVASLIYLSFKEREPLNNFYHTTLALFDDLNAKNYIFWELILLEYSGFGLDLTKCAATGAVDDLCFVSPKTGRAVSKEAGIPYKDVLLLLPKFLICDNVDFDVNDIKEGLNLSGYFLKKHIFNQRNMPYIRSILEDYLLNEKIIV